MISEFLWSHGRRIVGGRMSFASADSIDRTVSFGADSLKTLELRRMCNINENGC